MIGKISKTVSMRVFLLFQEVFRAVLCAEKSNGMQYGKDNFLFFNEDSQSKTEVFFCLREESAFCVPFTSKTFSSMNAKNAKKC